MMGGVKVGSSALVLMLAMLAFVLVQCVDRADAGHGSPIMELATTSSGLPEGFDDLRMYEDPEDQFLDEPARRLLAARRRSYISYGALNRNRSPCPARSGRSYYTPNCNSNAGPARPYTRGCLRITRCQRV